MGPMEQERSASGQVTGSAAEVYEQFFVPALFGQWPGVVLDAAGLTEGDDVLDVGCGTGVLAREAAGRLGGTGSVTGVDVNEGMLAVARTLDVPVTWRQGDAAALPFADASFDRVVSQFVLMFLPDRERGVAEMARVARAQGAVAVATWCRLEDSPGYAAMAELLDDVLGRSAAEALRPPFSLGEAEALESLLGSALGDVTVRRHGGTAAFPSLKAWVHTEIRGWTLADAVDDEQYARLLHEASAALGRFVGADGRVAFPVAALVGTGRPAG